jgi:hypothetical protein
MSSAGCDKSGIKATVMACRVAWLGLLALGSVHGLGCARVAPGPEECVAFAEAWLRGHRPLPPARLETENAFDELVRRCLTEPYDRELVSCVIGGRNQERCRVDYARRAEARREARER